MNYTVDNTAYEYAPYNRMDAFWHGAADYNAGRPYDTTRVGVTAQAYDRGCECAMRVQRRNEWIEQNVGLN